MEYGAPRRTLAEAIRAMDAVTPKPKEQLSGLFNTHPSLDDRLAALEPLEPPPPVASADPTR